MGGCAICEKINSVIEQKKLKGHVSADLGLIDEVLVSKCRQHVPLLDWLSKILDFHGSRGMLEIRRDYFSSSFNFSNKPANESHYFWHTSPYFDVVRSQENQAFGFGIRLDPSWVNTDRLLRWYNNCIIDHEEKKCSSPDFLRQLPAPEPQLFIDTLDRCLTRAPKGSSYMALSYVWGRVKTVKVTKDNLDLLMEPGALDQLLARREIPKTIRHAIYLAQLLQQRYLWVDNLCMVQDDFDMMNHQLDRMASIFANADAVIVAIDGPNADYGLRGLKDAPDQEPRHVRQLTLPFGEKTLLKRHEIGEHNHSSHQKPYFTRGWTFQEHQFARRRICFEEDSFWFQCCCATNYEDHEHTEQPDFTRDWTFDVGYPALNIYSDMIKDFNQRQLSFPQDCLSAVAGMISCYTKAFKGGFLCGLPEMFFDAALLWQPGGDLDRRVPIATSTASPASEPCLPTWSWAGWRGPIDFDDWATGNDWVAACRGMILTTECQAFRITDWYTGTDPDGADKRRIEDEWCTWRERYKHESSKLPEGWKKQLRDPEEGLTVERPPDGHGKNLYTHDSCSARFWYPIPLFDPSTQPKPKPNTRYLFGSVQTAQLYTQGAVSTPEVPEKVWMSTKRNSPRVSLCNSRNEWAGVLRLHSRDYLAKAGIDPAESKHALQLIALSRGSIPNGLDYGNSYIEEYLTEQRPRQEKMYEYYNVMWITWEAGVARREAVGRVHKDMWESLEPSVIDVVIG
ncbi:heterokaryon incompatibility protein [Diplodia corticola]|uniref:Heterokaryon incompatibility protein n=1 Tax=Diplodia corticola TaxID=236234 RepID=A0A1J9RFZ0_9PEZI|nr:heterokaryon incompatibility protein [Diplodia corticola]OJD40454.1 heterokaryon incompatibility protein [Diplodia corticola]